MSVRAISFADLSGIDRQTSRNVYAIVLRNDIPSPIAPESDEEKIQPEKKDAPPVVMPSVTPTPNPSPTVAADTDGNSGGKTCRNADTCADSEKRN